MDRAPLSKEGTPTARPTAGFVVRALWDRFLYRTASLGFDLLILMGMALLLFATVLSMGGQIRLFQASVILPISVMFAALLIKVKRHPGERRYEALVTLRDWVPFLLIVFIYENLRDVAGQAMSWDIAGLMNQWDVLLFGVEPTIWVQKLHTRVATDLFSLTYALWFFQPLFIMFLLSVWGRRREFRHMSLCLSLVFLLGFLGYILLPCSPPRYFIEHLYTDPVRLQGLFFFERLQGTWDQLSVISGGAFPSLHVGSSTVALLYAWHYRHMNRTMMIVWYAFVPLVLALWFSTVYLRHHWVIDIVAGWLVAAAGYVGAALLMRVWRNLRERYGLPF